MTFFSPSVRMNFSDSTWMQKWINITLISHVDYILVSNIFQSKLEYSASYTSTFNSRVTTENPLKNFWPTKLEIKHLNILLRDFVCFFIHRSIIWRFGRVVNHEKIKKDNSYCRHREVQRIFHSLDKLSSELLSEQRHCLRFQSFLRSNGEDWEKSFLARRVGRILMKISILLAFPVLEKKTSRSILFSDNRGWSIHDLED